MTIIDFHVHLRPDAMERLEEAKTLAVRREHDSAMRQVEKPSVIHLSWVGRVLAWFGRWA